jgi:uncharacterized membrane protein YbhN (UPF0104 family)
MQPITIRYYGLIPIRKQTYLILQSIVLLICALWMIVGLILLPYNIVGLNRSNISPFSAWILDHFLFIGLAVTVAEIVDTIFTLRAFRRKEAEEKLRHPAALSSAPRPADTHVKESDDHFRQRM